MEHFKIKKIEIKNSSFKLKKKKEKKRVILLHKSPSVNNMKI